MSPPLGTYSPETRHLNLKWTVGDVDRLIRSARSGMSSDQIADELRDTSLASTPDEISSLLFGAGVFVKRGRRA